MNASPPHLDLADLAHRLGDDESFVDEILEAYMEDAPQRLTEAREALSAGDMDTAGRRVHSLKGISANVSAKAMVELCRAFEAAAKQDAGSTEEAFAALETHFDELSEIIRDRLAGA